MIKHILIADDDPDILHLFDTFFKKEGYSTDLATDGLDALLKMKEKAPDLLITDIIMDVLDGLALIREAKELYPDMPVIAISGGRRVMSLKLPIGVATKYNTAIVSIPRNFSLNSA